VYGLHWIAVSLECEGRALADEELAVATLAARAMAAVKEKIGRMEFLSGSFEQSLGGPRQGAAAAFALTGISFDP
jgi:hypothetical protein